MKIDITKTAPRLRDQFYERGLRFDQEKIDEFQKGVDAINLLSTRKLITSSAATYARVKLKEEIRLHLFGSNA